MAFMSHEEAEIVIIIIIIIIICCYLLSFTNPKIKHGFWKRKNFHHHLHHPICSFITAVSFPFFRMQKLAFFLSLSLSLREFWLFLSQNQTLTSGH
jgi:hypothetical protein